MFRIRRILDASAPANKACVEQVIAILRQRFATLSVQELESLAEKLNNPLKYRFQCRLLVAERKSDQIQGFAILLYVPDLNFCLLDYLAAGKEVSGRGLGGALYGRVKEECRNLNVRALFMECLPDDPELSPDPAIRKENEKRLAFYEDFGAFPIDGTLYETPIKEGDTDPPYLVIDTLGGEFPERGFLSRAVRAILERKYGDVCPPSYIENVSQSFLDGDPVLRPPRYLPLKKRSADRELDKEEIERSRRIYYFANHEHLIHHVKERGYVESPVRVGAILKELAPLPFMEEKESRAFSDRHILAVHDRDFFNFLKRACAAVPEGKSVYPYVFPIRNQTRHPEDTALLAGYYCIDTFTPINKNAYAAARQAVDCCLSAADSVLSRSGVAYALVRPPGHHAERRSFGGFCYFSNTAIAAQYLSAYGRVAILDIDYHHGNGQQDIFWRREDVLTISLHGHPRFAYPYFTGFPDEKGEGPGTGFNINYAMPEKLDNDDYIKTLRRALNKIEEFSPDYLVVALGLDTSKADPTGTWTLGAESFRAIGTMLGSLCLPTLVVQEGGYRTRTLGANCRNFFHGIYSSWRPVRIKRGQRRDSAHREAGRLLRYSVSRLDIEPVGKMVTDTGVFSAEEVDCAKELVAEASERGEDGSGYRFVFLEQGGEMLGYACFGRVPLTEGSFDLYWLVVDPRYHRQGVAAELLSAVEAETERLGGRSIYVETSSTAVYAPARAFYMNQGYEEVSRLKDFYRPGDDRITFLKRFT